MPASLAAWSGLIGLSLVANYLLHRADLVHGALEQARLTCQAIDAVGPGYMAQHGHRIPGKFLGVEAHFTALDGERRENTPDSWERQALKRVAGHPEAEVSELREIAGRPVLQVLRPLVIREECLGCHGQGYKLGDTRGGISVEVPLGPFEAARRPLLLGIMTVHGLFWALGSATLFWVVRNSRRRARERAIAEARFRQLFEDAPVAYHELDREGVVQRVNRAECDLLGYERDAMIGHPIWDFLAAQDRETGLQAIRKKVAGELPLVPVQRHYVRRDGRELVLEIHDSLARNADGSVSGIRTALLDITERTLAETTLREHEEMFRALTSSALNAMVLMDSGGRVLLWNAAAERMFGYSAAEALGQPVHNLVAPAGLRSQFHRNFLGFSESGTGPMIGKVTQVRAIRKDGSEFPIELSLSAVQRGTEWQAVAIIRDISSLQQSQEEAELAHRKLSTLVENLESSSRRNETVREMNEFLQSCSSVEEAGPVIARSMTRLFPHSRGVLYLLSPSRADLDPVVTWGSGGRRTECAIVPDACWALRRGRNYQVKDVENSLICAHVEESEAAPYACWPLMANTEVVGMLHLVEEPGTPGDPAQSLFGGLADIATTLCEQVSMSLSNLRLRETLRAQSIRDPLTGLFNRRYMEESLQRELWRAGRKGYPISILMADIDHFKKFNDVHGHTAGDLVLAEFGRLLKAETRGSDISCRFGGEEFAIILVETALEDAVRRADQLRQRVKGLRLSYVGQEIGPITVSLGVSVYPENGVKSDELLRTADAALYRAKQAGRDRVVTSVQMAEQAEPDCVLLQPTEQ